MSELERLYEKWKMLQPLPETKQRLLSQKFSVEYNYNSNHIEGNTLTYGQTELLLLFGKVSGEGDLKDFVDMKASAVGVKMVEEAVVDRSVPMTQNFIRQLHKVLLREDYTVYRNLPGGHTTSYTVHAGQYKTRPNSVITRYGTRFEYATPEETSSLMSDLVDWYNEAETSGKYSPVELAALFHYRYIRIHPFEDGNGRIARLMVNYILARHGWPMIVVRNRNKADYLEALNKSDNMTEKAPASGSKATLTQIAHFLRFFEKTVIEELRYNIEFATETKETIWWYDGQSVDFKRSKASQILYVLRYFPWAKHEEICNRVQISNAGLIKQLRKLTDNKYIDRNEKGEWRVMICPSVEKDISL